MRDAGRVNPVHASAAMFSLVLVLTIYIGSVNVEVILAIAGGACDTDAALARFDADVDDCPLEDPENREGTMSVLLIFTAVQLGVLAHLGRQLYVICRLYRREDWRR